MPLVAHTSLPTFDRLRDIGQEILDVERAHKQDIRELHIGLLNLMPDAALQATERQFMRLIGTSNRIAQFYVHLFTVGSEARGEEAQAHIDAHYESFDDLRDAGVDALIITGANPVQSDLTAESFWEPMTEVITWGQENTCSVLCSCLATHADLKHKFGVERIRLPQKRWGVYSHRVVDTSHPLVSNINTRFDAPHSHVYEVTPGQVRDAGARVLAESEQAGVHLAVSKDGFRVVYFQGHPEYDIHSLLKEYKREVSRFNDGMYDAYPVYPEHYFPPAAQKILEAYRATAQLARSKGETPPDFPEDQVVPHVDNTWVDTGKAMFNNWLGLVYQTTNPERGKLFMPGVDPENPLGARLAGGR